VSAIRPDVKACVSWCVWRLDIRYEVCISLHMDSRAIITALKVEGWRQVAKKGSHVQFKHPTKLGRVTVPHPKRDIPMGTLRSIEQQSGVKLR
jgi:predicted RNA binding protein YcfA (HicA-like mRNA interferase family)